MATFPHFSTSYTFELSAPPNLVFPLLCPVRERDWIPTWQAEIVFSRSGFAELDCVFLTENAVEGKRTWICTRYEPHHAIEYTSFSDVGYVMRLLIELEPHVPGRTRVSWSRRFFATGAAGASFIESLDGEMAAKATQRLATLLDYYLRTGAMLRD